MFHAAVLLCTAYLALPLIQINALSHGFIPHPFTCCAELTVTRRGVATHASARHELQGAFFLLCAHRHKARARVHDPSLGSSCVAHSRGTGLKSFVIKGVNLDRLIGLFCIERADRRIAFYLPL